MCQESPLLEGEPLVGTSQLSLSYAKARFKDNIIKEGYVWGDGGLG